MDEYLHKKPSGGHSISKRGSNIVFREQKHRDRSIQNCNRLRCSTMHNPKTGPQIGIRGESKYTTATRPTSAKSTTGNSLRSFPGPTSSRASFHGSQNQGFPRQTALSGSNNRQENIEDKNDNRWPTNLEDVNSDTQLEREEVHESMPTTIVCTGSAFLQEISTGATDSSVRCSPASSSNTHKQTTNGKFSENHSIASSSFIRHSPIADRSPSHAARPVSQVAGTMTQKYGLKNLGCTSITDVVPSGCSSSDFARGKNIDMIIKRPFGGKSSTSKGKAPSASAAGVSQHAGSSSRNLTTAESSKRQQDSRISRNRPARRDNSISLRTQSTCGRETQRISRQGGDSTVLINDPVVIPQLQETLFSNLETGPVDSSGSFSMEFPHSFHDSFEQTDLNLWPSRRSAFDHEDNSMRTFDGSLEDRDRYRHFNVQGVAEQVLHALQRIEQDEELTYEQLLMLETSLFLSGISFHDQHRDMRMDIDHMSYEELLALEEKIGTVSTALSEDQLLKSVKRSRYAPVSLKPGISIYKEDDLKCSICQEEYVAGDEMGKLPCQHQYHVSCIQQWLRQKNWCPICKSSALSSQTK